MPGPLPSATHQRARDTARRQGYALHVEDDGELRGPEFPHNLVPYPSPATAEWWETWRRAPQAALFLPTDWQALKRAALVHEAIVTAGTRVSAAALAELRMIEERLGGTLADRMRLKLRVSPATAKLAPVTEPSDIRARLAAARVGQTLADVLDVDGVEPESTATETALAPF